MHTSQEVAGGSDNRPTCGAIVLSKKIKIIMLCLFDFRYQLVEWLRYFKSKKLSSIFIIKI